jgi:Uncharacterised protein family (UPF0259)
VTIEFHCPVCQKLLKTADDKAGVRANCPGCGQSVAVPDLAHEGAAVDSSLEPAEVRREALPSQASVVPHDAGLADSESLSGETKACPMCGAEIKLAAKRCRFCGEDLVDHRAEGLPTHIEAGDVLSKSWEIYKKNFGLLVGSTLVVLAIGLVAFAAAYVVFLVGFISIVGIAGGIGKGPPKNDAGAMIAFGVFYVLFIGFILAIQAFLQGGYQVMMIRIARGERAEVGDVFTGARYFWRLFWGNLLFTLLAYVGLALLLVPGVFVMLIFAPFSYVIVDRNVGVIESLRKSRELTSGNLLAIFVLGLSAFGLQMLGSLACYVGLIFTIPLIVVIFAVAYCAMSGQALADTSRG